MTRAFFGLQGLPYPSMRLARIILASRSSPSSRLDHWFEADRNETRRGGAPVGGPGLLPAGAISTPGQGSRRGRVFILPTKRASCSTASCDGFDFSLPVGESGNPSHQTAVRVRSTRRGRSLWHRRLRAPGLAPTSGRRANGVFCVDGRSSRRNTCTRTKVPANPHIRNGLENRSRTPVEVVEPGRGAVNARE